MMPRNKVVENSSSLNETYKDSHRDCQMVKWTKNKKFQNPTPEDK